MNRFGPRTAISPIVSSSLDSMVAPDLVDELELDARQRRSDPARDHRLAQAGARVHQRLGHPVALQHLLPGEPLDPVVDAGRQRRRARDQHARARERLERCRGRSPPPWRSGRTWWARRTPSWHRARAPVRARQARTDRRARPGRRGAADRASRSPARARGTPAARAPRGPRPSNRQISASASRFEAIARRGIWTPLGGPGGARRVHDERHVLVAQFVRECRRPRARRYRRQYDRGRVNDRGDSTVGQASSLSGALSATMCSSSRAPAPGIDRDHADAGGQRADDRDAQLERRLGPHGDAGGALERGRPRRLPRRPARRS